MLYSGKRVCSNETRRYFGNMVVGEDYSGINDIYDLPPVNSNALYALIRRCMSNIALEPENEDKYNLYYELFSELCEATEKLIQSEKLEDAYKGIKVYYRLEDDAREEIFDKYCEPYYTHKSYLEKIIYLDQHLYESYGVARLII